MLYGEHSTDWQKQEAMGLLFKGLDAETGKDSLGIPKGLILPLGRAAWKEELYKRLHSVQMGIQGTRQGSLCRQKLKHLSSLMAGTALKRSPALKPGTRGSPLLPGSVQVTGTWTDSALPADRGNFPGLFWELTNTLNVTKAFPSMPAKVGAQHEQDVGI